MLETDCKIPTEFQPIMQPERTGLYGTAAAIKGMLDAGHHAAYIRKTLCIQREEYRDALFEIRKAGYSMNTKVKSGKLAGKYAEIYEAWKNGQTVTALAEQYDVAKPSISYIIKKMKSKEGWEMLVNQENENAAAQTDKPTVTAETTPAAPPDVVRKAVLYRIADIDEECNAAEAKINALREKIRDLTKERGELEIWMEEVKRNESTEA